NSDGQEEGENGPELDEREHERECSIVPGEGDLPPARKIHPVLPSPTIPTGNDWVEVPGDAQDGPGDRNREIRSHDAEDKSRSRASSESAHRMTTDRKR